MRVNQAMFWEMKKEGLMPESLNGHGTTFRTLHTIENQYFYRMKSTGIHLYQLPWTIEKSVSSLFGIQTKHGSRWQS